MSDYVRGLHFIGKLDRKEEAYILSKQQEEAVVRRLIVKSLYGLKRVRDVWDPGRAERTS